MPPRFTYWTIILDGQPTAFRAADRETLLPTLRQLQSKNPDAVLKWFARGKVWESPEEARAHAPRHDRDHRRTEEDATRGATGAKAEGEQGPRRSKEWRPGGEHKDPREKFKKETFQARKRRERKAADLARAGQSARWSDRPGKPEGRGRGPSDPAQARPWERGGKPEGGGRPAGERGPKRPWDHNTKAVSPKRGWDQRAKAEPKRGWDQRAKAEPKRDWDRGGRADGGGRAAGDRGPKRPWDRNADKAAAPKRPWDRSANKAAAPKRPWDRNANKAAAPKRPWDRNANKAAASKRDWDHRAKAGDRGRRQQAVNREEPAAPPAENPRPIVTDPRRPPEPERQPNAPEPVRPSQPESPERIRILPEPPEQGERFEGGFTAPAHETKLPRLRKK